MRFQVELTPDFNKTTKEDFLRRIFSQITTNIEVDSDEVVISIRIEDDVQKFVKSVNYGISGSFE